MTKVRKHIETLRLKYGVTLRRSRADADLSARAYVGLEHIESCTGRLLGSEPPERHVDQVDDGDSQQASAFEPGDVLFGKLRPYLAKAWVADFPGRCTTELLVMTPKAFNARFLRYVCLSSGFINEVDASTFGSKMPRAEWDYIGSRRIPLPTPDRQLRIADYLDLETAKLDAMVAAKERLLGLLSEKRRALITHAVTGGLNPDAPLRDSGIEWLGHVPSHWEIERAKWLFRERDERSMTGDEELLTVSHITGVTPRSEKNVTMFEAESMEGYKLCYPGDLAVNTLWAWMGAMGISNHFGIISPAYNVYTPCDRLMPAYVEAVCRTQIFADEARRHSTGVWSSRLRLYPEGLFEISFPVPPRDEQVAIAAAIQRESARADALRDVLLKSVALLSERRAALIAAAVTGLQEVEA